jgi:hypothetical protein
MPIVIPEVEGKTTRRHNTEYHNWQHIYLIDQSFTQWHITAFKY